MYDHETIISVADEIIVWQSAAQRILLPELRAMLAEWQETLAVSLDTFNSIYATHGDHAGCTDLIKEAISNLAQVATTTAIFTLGVTKRAHVTAHQN